MSDEPTAEELRQKYDKLIAEIVSESTEKERPPSIRTGDAAMLLRQRDEVDNDE